MSDAAENRKRKMLDYWFRLVDSGVSPDLSFDRNKRIRVLNSISLCSIVASLITFFRGYFMELYRFLWLTASGMLAMILVIYLNGNHRYKTAGWIFFTYIPLHITVSSSLAPLGFELYTFPMMVIAGFVIRKRIFLVLYLCMLGILFILLSSNLFPIFQFDIEPFFLTFFYLSSAIFSFILCFLSVNLFIRQYEENRNEVMIMNEMLNESVRTAKQDAQFKALLVREMNHRVKNNLQLITSLLNIHQRKLKDSRARKALQDAGARVQSIALIHNRLSKSKAIEKVNIRIYLRELVEGLADIIPGFHEEVDFSYSCEDVEVQVEDAVSIGLIINELITNSVQHGLSDSGDEKQIKLIVREPKTREIMISVEDSGSGLKENYLPENKGLGLELVETLAHNYSGRIGIDDQSNKLTVLLKFDSSSSRN